MGVDIPLQEQVRMLRQDIIALLSRNPHCPIAQLLGQALMDLHVE